MQCTPPPTHTTKQGLYKSGRGVYWYPASCLTSRFFFFQQVHAESSYANPTQDLTSAATRGVVHATQIDKGVDHFNMSICHLDCWARHGWGSWSILVCVYTGVKNLTNRLMQSLWTLKVWCRTVHKCLGDLENRHTHTHTHESVTKILPSALSMVIRAVSCTFVVYAQNNYQNSDWIYFFILFYFIFIYFFCICNSAVFYCTVFYIHIYFTVSVLYKLLGLFVCSAVELSVLINLSWVEYYHSMCVRTVMLRTRMTKSGEAQQCVEPHSPKSGGRASPAIRSLRLCLRSTSNLTSALINLYQLTLSNAFS